MLSASAIASCVEKGEMEILPFDASFLKGASYTFTLAASLRVMKKSLSPTDLRLGKPDWDEVSLTDTGYVLAPGAFVLGKTVEHLSLFGKYACILSGRGSVAQVGLNVLQSSAFAEPDTDNPQILEISNVGVSPVVLYSGMPIVKGIFFQL